jgi:hypothetical protein
MGAWSEHTFGNDAACDWVGDFNDSPGLQIVENAIDAILEETDYVDSYEACECLAACEVIARLSGRWGLRDPYSEDIDRWVEANPVKVPEELTKKALKAIDKIMGEDSELPEEWEGDEDWLKAMDDLISRVRG